MNNMVEIKNPILINNKNFKTNIIKLYFPVEVKKENYLLDISLKTILEICNNNFRSKKEFDKELIKLCIMSYNVTLISLNNFGYFVFTLVISKEKITPTYYIDAINFLMDTIYNPYIKDNYEELKLGKNRLKSGIKKDEKSIDASSYNEFMHLVNKDYYTLIDFKDDIDKLGNKKVYEHYKNVIINNKPIVLVFGDQNTTIFNLIRTRLNDKFNSSIKINTDYYDIIKPNILKEKMVNKNYNKSLLYVNYLIKDYSCKDKYKLDLVYYILNNSSSNILYKILRQEYNLVYSCSCDYSNKHGYIYINANIDKNNKDKCEEAIKKCIILLKDKTYIKNYLKIIKEKGVDSLITFYDDKYDIINDKFFNLIDYSKTKKEYVNELLKIREKDICEFVDRFIVDTIYFVRGEK